MESSLGEMDKNGEELTGRKKSRFKQLKTRLFGKLKKKESEGLMKQSQSASDITVPEAGRESYDSEEECLYPQCLSSRALSHDSIFIPDQPQSTEPTRVLSQENVHDKIKALQLKLQHQNLRLGLPPMLIPGRRTEDSGATSEDDGLPCSPPEMSFHEQDMHGTVYKYSESKKHLSSLSLAGTGSEEEEQGDPFQPLSRPLSPISKPFPQPIICPTPALTTPSTTPAGVDFSSPVHYTPRLDNSAARHRMSIKPRNQRVSTRCKRAPMISPRHRSESVSDLDNILSEEDDEETTSTTETMRHRLYSSPTLKLREKPTSPEPKGTTSSLSVQNQTEKPPEINLLSMNDKMLKSAESNEPEERVANNPLYLQPMSSGLSSGRASPVGLPEFTQISRETEPLRAHSPIQRHDTKNIQILESKRFWGSSENLVFGTDKKDSLHKDTEALFRLHPVPHIRKPNLEMRNPTSPKGAIETSTKLCKVEPSTPEISPKGVTGSPSGKDTQTLNSASLQFSIASAKYRSKTNSTTVAKQNEGNLKVAPGIKTKPSRPTAEPQKDEAREMKLTELQNLLVHQTQEMKSSPRREVISPVISKTNTGNHFNKKTETYTENVEAEKIEEPDDRKNAFGVQLRTTSLSLKYRSDVSKIKDETKRYSLESNQMTSVFEEQAWKAETLRNMCEGNSKSKVSVSKKQDLQTPSYHPLLNKIPTNQSPQVHASSPTLPPLQPPKPTIPPKTQLLSSIHLPIKTQATGSQTSTHQTSLLTTQRSPTKLVPNGNREGAVSPGRRVENPFSQSAGGGRLTDSKLDKSMTAVRNIVPEADASKKATASRQEPITPANMEAPTVTSEPSPASSSSEVSHHFQPRSDGSEPSWMELAKRKSLAWSDKTLE